MDPAAQEPAPQEPVAQVEQQEEPVVEQPAPEPTPAPTEKKRKRKIDLKSRLSSVRATGSMAAIQPSQSGGDRKSDPLSVPPPPSTGSVPAPKLPGGLLPSVSSPFAPPEPEKKVSAQQQTIKVEVGEEIHEQRKKARKSTFLVAGGVLVVGGALGFFMGTSYQANAAGRAAAKQASGLLEDVQAAQTAAGDMSDTIRKAEEQLKQDTYPTELAKYLRDTSVDFGADVYGEHKPGGLPKDVLGSLISYANSVDKFQKQKLKVAGLLDKSQETVEEFFESKETVKAGFAVTFQKAKEGEGDDKKEFIYGTLGVLSEPFAWENKAKWPEKFQLKIGRDESEALLFGPESKLTGGEKSSAVVLDPETTQQFSRGGQVWFILRSQVHELYELIEGKESRDPNQQLDGIIKDGKTLVTGLEKVVQAGQ
jgi:hypothetical protein